MRSKTPLQEYILANKAQVLLTCAAMFVSGLLGVLLPLSIGGFYSVVLGAGGGKDRLLHEVGLSVSDTSGFFRLFGGLIAGLALSTYLAQVTSSSLTERFARDLQTRLFARQLHGSLATHMEKPVGSYLLRYSGDLRGVRDLIRKGILQAVGDVFLLLIAFSAMLWIDVHLAFVVIIGFLVSVTLVAVVGRPMSVINAERRKQRSRILEFVASRFNAFRTIKSFNRETPEINAFERTSDKSWESAQRYHRWGAGLQAMIPALFFMAMATVLWLVAQKAEHGQKVHVADVLGFVLLMLYTRSPMRRLLQVNTMWQSGLASLQKLNTVLTRPIEEREGPELPKDFNGNITFSGVRFAYGESPPVLDGVDLRFPSHAITHLQGESGAGRTTVLALIQKLHTPQAGTITFDEVNIEGLSAFAVRRETTVVSDDVPLLGSTVQKAITYNTRDKSEERAVRMVERLGIELAESLEATLAFELEGSGANLSRGQQRMLQFARALLTRKTILLLDEPFKDLGAEDLSRVIAIMNELRTCRTIILASTYLPAGLIVDHTAQLPSS